MILELDTSLFKEIENLSINQLVFLTLVQNTNQSDYQDIHEFLSRISETDVQQLIDNGYVTVNISGDIKIYNPSEKLLNLTKPKKEWFDEFYEVFPVYVTRPDGSKGFLRANINKCRREYNRIVGKSRAMHEHLLKCLKYELDDKVTNGKLGYLKTMWKWLTQHEWEAIEDQMNDSNNILKSQDYGYGNTII